MAGRYCPRWEINYKTYGKDQKALKQLTSPRGTAPREFIILIPVRKTIAQQNERKKNLEKPWA